MNSAAGASLVAVRLPAGDQWLRTVTDIWAVGDAVLPLPVDAADRVLADTIAELKPSALIDASGTTALDGGVPVERGTAVVLVTSGSTGTPKGAVLSTDALHAAVQASLSRLEVVAEDRWLSCLPLEHIAGMQVVLRARLMGSNPVLHPRFSVDAVAGQRDVTHVSLVPTMLRRLLDAGADLRHLKRVLLGGAAASEQLLADARAAGIAVVITYGMTETCGGCVYDGVPLQDVSVEIAQDGRIKIACPFLFSGYRLRDDLTAAVVSDGWLTTEDLGRIAPDGRLEVLGRADDVIITGGEKVSAGDLADLLERHPAIREAAVTARPDPEWGQVVVAYITPRGPAPTLDDVRGFVRTHAPAYAAPRDLVVLAELPRLPSGKVDRLALQ
jgi:o-succinylbenzoate---CoA ligase